MMRPATRLSRLEEDLRNTQIELLVLDLVQSYIDLVHKSSLEI